MKKYLSFCVIACQVLASCSSDSNPNPEPQPNADKPGKALLTYPVNNKECEQGEVSGNSATVEFSWEASADTENYALNIKNLDNNTNTSRTGLSGTVTEVSLERGHPYSWNVTSKNSSSQTTTSDTWKFYLASDGESNFAPFPAEAIAPSPGETVTPNNGKITIQWESVQDPDGDEVTYTLYADDTDGLQTPPDEWQGISETSMEISVSANTVYYWRVMTSDGNNSATSSTYSFKTVE